MAAFSGPTGLVVKLTLLAVVNALAIWAATILGRDGKWIALVVLVASTVAIDLIYLWPTQRTLPAKFLVPGTVLLLCFQVTPILYTINVAFTNYATGHILSKSEAIDGIKVNSLAQPENGKAYTLSPAEDADGKLVLLLVDDATGKPYVGTRGGLEPLPAGDVTIAGGAITAASGFTLLKGAKLFTLDPVLADYRVPVGGSSAIHAEGIDAAFVEVPTLRYDPAADTFTQIKTGDVFRDNGKGSFVSASGEELEPGWKTYVGFTQFRRIVNDPLIRRPFLRVFAWTFSFAFLTVFLSFALGLFLAITLQKPIRFRSLYRTVIVVPYAIPAFLMILVWAGLLNDQFGVVNHVLHTSIPWLFDPWWARTSIVFVSVWLTFPYFFLVSLAALQSIPAELTEAARVDGAGPLQVFRRITLPLLLVAVAPLLIASFAFNFNNFNVVYLLTKGGPAAGDQPLAGSTDILISYTYKLAFETGTGGAYALACAVSLIIFFIVASISVIAFRQSRFLETMQ
jgi:arabinogalactan oligomer/maltooligosaccharide transport system permease protein